GLHPNVVASRYMARHGCLLSLVVAVRAGCPLDKSVSSAAAKGGRTPTLVWLLENDCPVDSTRVCLDAGTGGHLSALVWARDNGFPWKNDVCMAAAA
ncbi:unnamed protein product, partial [Hapterophycus canaliculatus]